MISITQIRPRRSLAVLFLVIALANLADRCPAQQPFEYKLRGNRREGLKSEFNSKLRYEVRGILGGNEDVSADPNANLNIGFYVPPSAAPSGAVIGIQAQELQKNKNYLMEPVLPLPREIPGQWTTFSPWPAGDVLANVHIPPAKLGILVSIKLPNVANVFAPALFYSKRAAPRVDNYTIFFSSDKPVEHVHCVVVDVSNQKVPCSLPKGVTFLQSKITAPFTVNAANVPDGMLTVAISGEYTDDESGDGLHAVFHMYHQHQVNIP